MDSTESPSSKFSLDDFHLADSLLESSFVLEKDIERVTETSSDHEITTAVTTKESPSINDARFDSEDISGSPVESNDMLQPEDENPDVMSTASLDSQRTSDFYTSSINFVDKSISTYSLTGIENRVKETENSAFVRTSEEVNVDIVVNKSLTESSTGAPDYSNKYFRLNPPQLPRSSGFFENTNPPGRPA